MKSSIEGKKILLTRPQNLNKEWAERFEAIGAITVIFPLIEITAIEDLTEIHDTAARINQFDWIIFNSINSARYSLEIINKVLLSSHKIQIAAIGSKTAAYLENHGLEVDFMPRVFTSAYMGEELGDVKNRKILIPRTNIADDDLTEQLKKRGATVTELTVYNTAKVSGVHDELQKILDKGIDVVTFASSSAAESFCDLKVDKKNAKVAVIGPVTAERCIKMGLKPDIIAESYTTEGLTQAILNYFENK